jgi:hypothetical protein
VERGQRQEKQKYIGLLHNFQGFREIWMVARRKELFFPFFLDNPLKKSDIISVPERESATGGGGSGSVRKSLFRRFPGHVKAGDFLPFSYNGP